MKASSLIFALESVIENYGDMEVALSNNIDKKPSILFSVSLYEKDIYDRKLWQLNDFLKSNPFVLLGPSFDKDARIRKIRMEKLTKCLNTALERCNNILTLSENPWVCTYYEGAVQAYRDILDLIENGLHPEISVGEMRQNVRDSTRDSLVKLGWYDDPLELGGDKK